MLLSPLCVDGPHQDLHFLAVDGGERSLAELAKHRAENVDSDEIDSGEFLQVLSRVHDLLLV